MTTIRFHKVDEMFELVLWTPLEEKLFVNLVIEFKDKGHILHTGSQADTFSEITSRLHTEIGKTFAVQKVVKKFNSLSTRYDLWEAVLNWPCVRLNGGEHKFEAGASTWDDIIKVHPYANKYISQLELELDIIFGQFTRKDDLRRLFEFLRGLSFHDTSPNVAAKLHEDRNEHATVNDEHSVVGRVHHLMPLSAPSAYDPSFGIG